MTRLMRVASILLALSLSALPCIVSAKDKCPTSADGLGVARVWVRSHEPEELKPPYPKPVLKDAIDLWMVVYGLPEGAVGGAPTVFVEKKTCKIVQVISGQ